MIGSTIAIYRKELLGYFTSPIAYIVAAVFWALSGYAFVQILVAVTLQAEIGAQYGQSFDAARALLQNFLGFLGPVFLFLSPALTMGLYAEERRRGTMELLATSPITNLSVALGKWLAVVTLFVTMLLPLLVYQVLAYGSSQPAMDYRLVLTGHLGLILLVGGMMALGMFISSLTDNTIISAIGTFGLVLLLWVLNAAAGQDGSWWAATLRHLSLFQQYNTWLQGTISTSSLALFLSLIGLGIFLTVQSVEALRWQQN